MIFRKGHNRSFFVRFLYSYLMILLVPFLTIFVTYACAEVSIRNEILISSENSLHQFFNNVDSRLSEMVHTSFKVLQDDSVKRRAYESEAGNGYDTYQIKQYLSGLPQDTFSDVFVYYYDSDRIISAGYSSLSCSSYASTYYAKNLEIASMSEEAFRDNLILDRGNTPELISLGGAITQPTLAVAMAQNAGYALGEPEMTACVALHPSLLAEMLQSANFHRDGVILIFNKDGTPLAASAEFQGELDLSRYTDGVSREDTIGGQKYMVQLFDSTVLDCTYVSLTSASAFWEKLNTLRTVCLVSLTLCMCISAAVTVYLSKRNYSPITSLLRTIHSKTNRQYDRSEQDELEFVRTILQQSFEENNLLSSRIENESHALREDFLLRALQGTWNQDGEEDAFSAHQISLLSDKFCAVLIRVESFDENLVGSRENSDTQRLLSLIFANIFEELCAASHQGFIPELGAMRQVGLLNFRGAPDEALTADVCSICMKLSDLLTNHFGICFTWAVSEIQSGLQGIHTAYAQAVHAMNYRFLYGKGKSILYRDVKNRPFRYNSAAESKASQILLNYVYQDSKETPAQATEAALACFEISPQDSCEAVQCIKYELTNTVGKIARQIGPSLPEEDSLIRRLFDADTLFDYRAILEEALNQLRQLRLSSHETHTICDKAASYIQDHYTDPNLNNNALGNALNISPSYLSRLFKLQFGQAPLDYLYQLRIESAKELLSHTAMTMEDIAVRTGFLNGTALIKIFRKIEGITPGAYRKLMQNNT